MKNLYTENSMHIGLLVVRVGMGVAMIFHGYPKLLGGAERWESVGSALNYLGITWGHSTFGFMAGLIETLGGLLLIFGIFHLPVVFFLLSTVLVALIFKINTSDGFLGFAHPLEVSIIFLGLLIAGPGNYSIDNIRKKQ
jgi:putative oxidoreductase